MKKTPYHGSMIESLHRISAVLFYVWGATLFLAYLFHMNLIGGAWPRWWLAVGDLPMGFIACLYGGISFYLSITTKERRSRVLLAVIGVLLTLIFLAMLTLNFWDAFGLSRLFA